MSLHSDDTVKAREMNARAPSVTMLRAMTVVDSGDDSDAEVDIAVRPLSAPIAYVPHYSPLLPRPRTLLFNIKLHLTT